MLCTQESNVYKYLCAALDVDILKMVQRFSFVPFRLWPFQTRLKCLGISVGFSEISKKCDEHFFCFNIFN